MDEGLPNPAGRLTTGRVVFLVIAAAAPLTAIVGNVPLALAYGNGAGLPAAFALAGIVLLCFCVGYAAMSRRVVSTGAFYTYVEQGMGQAPAISAAFLAVVSYTALTIGQAGALGYVMHAILASGGISVPWELFSAAALGIVATLGYRSVAVSARVVGVLVTAELVAVAVLDAGILVHHGFSALPTVSLSPRGALTGSIGIAVAFAITSFVGFETAALYGEETVDPRRSVARATYVALAFLMVFFFFTAWLVVGAIGAPATHDAARSQLSDLVFNIAKSNVGGWLYNAIAILFATSILGAMLAVHNAASRYLFSLGRDRVLPSALGRYHSRHLAPHVASLTVSATAAVVVAGFALARVDPLLTLSTSMVGLSTLGVLLLEVLAAVSVVVFFARLREGRYLQTVLIPLVGATGLLIAFVLCVLHFRTLVNTSNPIIANLPWVPVLVVLAGFLTGLWLPASRIRRAGSHTYRRRRADHGTRRPAALDHDARSDVHSEDRANWPRPWPTVDGQQATGRGVAQVPQQRSGTSDRQPDGTPR